MVAAINPLNTHLCQFSGWFRSPQCFLVVSFTIHFDLRHRRSSTFCLRIPSDHRQFRKIFQSILWTERIKKKDYEKCKNGQPPRLLINRPFFFEKLRVQTITKQFILPQRPEKRSLSEQATIYSLKSMATCPWLLWFFKMRRSFYCISDYHLWCFH